MCVERLLCQNQAFCGFKGRTKTLNNNQGLLQKWHQYLIRWDGNVLKELQWFCSLTLIHAVLFIFPPPPPPPCLILHPPLSP